jgi:DNA-binding NarL/FixJ family response regulator
MVVPLTTSSIRVLVVDDYAPWRRFVSSTLQTQPELEVVAEVSDGLDAIYQSQELQPDLILLDIGLPVLNGIEAARRIREVSPASKILFVSENRSVDVVEAALSTGAGGYVVKSDGASKLLPAVAAVLQGKQFVSVSLTNSDFSEPTKDPAVRITHRHEVAFYADDPSVVNGYACFIESALKSGNAVIVAVTESHRASLVLRLEADGVDVAAAIKQGSCILLDSTETLSRLLVDGTLDPVRCAQVVGDLITGAAKGVKGERARRVVVCGEIAPILVSKGNAEGAIKLEHLWDEITRGYGVDTLCGYLRSPFLSTESGPIFERICAEHSAVHRLGY